MDVKKTMIRAAFLLALFLCLAAPPAEAVWLFGNKKKESAAPKEAPKIYNAPAEKDPTKKWVLDRLFNRPKEQQLSSSPVFDMKIFDKLTPEMMTASYIPKDTAELGMIAVAHNVGSQPAMLAQQKAAKERVAAATAKHAAMMKKADQEAAKKQAALGKSGAANVGVPPSAQNLPLQPAPPRPVLYDSDKPVLKTPPKVFRDTR